MAVKARLPKWATLDRREYLVDLFKRSRGFCVFGHKNCLIPEHHFELFIESVIANWKTDDREQRLAEWEAECRIIHSLGERRYPLVGRFNAISRTIFADNQPLYYIQGYAISGLTFKPFAKVRVASSYMRLYVDLGDALTRVGKVKRRKAIRYGKPLPLLIENKVNKIVSEAVRDFLAH